MTIANPLPLRLSPALSFCRIEGQTVFLDVANDRYFCLAEPLEAAFAALANNDRADDAMVARLEAEHVLVRSKDGRALDACLSAVASATLVDGPLSPAARHYPGLLLGLVRTRWLLRRKPLAVLLVMLAHAKLIGKSTGRGSYDDLAAIAHTFERLAIFDNTHDQCLPRSLALATYLAARGHAPELIFAVRLGPFKAHCWVECEGAIAGGRLEEARHYTPILRV